VQGQVAVSLASKRSFAERVAAFGRPAECAVLVWDFRDLLHPELVLESPFEVTAFDFNRFDPSVIVGGCANGRVLLWEVGEGAGAAAAVARGGDDEHRDAAAVVAHKCVSLAEASHRAPVAALAWLPGWEVTGKGALHTGARGADGVQTCAFFATAASDGRINFWDVRVDQQRSKKRKGDGARLRCLLCCLKAPSPSMQSCFGSLLHDQSRLWMYPRTHARTHACMHACKLAGSSTIQSHRTRAPRADPADREWRPAYAMPLLSLAGADLTAVALDVDFNTPGDVVVGSADGELVLAHFVTPDGADNPDFTKSISRPHAGPVVALARSPYFPDVLLTAADWQFHIWRLGAPAPLFSAGSATEQYTAAAWSPTREAVLFLGLADGSLQCWDLLDRSHEPALQARAGVAATLLVAALFKRLPAIVAVTLSAALLKRPVRSSCASQCSHDRLFDLARQLTVDVRAQAVVCSTAIRAMAFNTAAATDKAQLLALGDDEGMLRVAEVPSTLRRPLPGEHALTARFLDTAARKAADADARQARRCFSADTCSVLCGCSGACDWPFCARPNSACLSRHSSRASLNAGHARQGQAERACAAGARRRGRAPGRARRRRRGARSSGGV
jgi:WD40 repeat protein